MMSALKGQFLPLLALLSFTLVACTVEEPHQDYGQEAGGLNGISNGSQTDDSQGEADPFGFSRGEAPDRALSSENPCPEGFEYSVNDDLVAFCIYHAIDVPQTDSLQPYLDDLHAGYLGFSWNMNDVPKYACPSTMRAIRTTEAIGYCVFSGIWVPETDTLLGHVEDLGSGSIGFSWYLDAEQDTRAPTNQRHH